ncbi:ABC transporter substrate-binding protein [Sulfolobus islandicus]|uniref:Extracellular ligand-binding receptor n=1 Tax=Saccharolobus islandicus (strain HVE10/4) TaxID=930943 RepID=F0NLP8_SACI0|nr:penicillin-binding protein activator [Sulfolobus islandicus]ADX83739.1 Extracellular ligand-binding receptor [Sulfolobus islandicus HVE10/4]WCM37539.1 ABC transporter substrate-binding protein [Sulfolobus islandicus]
MKGKYKRAISTSTAIIIAVVVIILIVVGVVAYFQQMGSHAPTSSSSITTQSSLSSTSQSQTSAQEVIKIGALLPLTGQLSSVGAEAQQVLIYAQGQANSLLKQLGVNMQVQVVIEDTATNPQTALSDLQTLYSQGVRLVIGPFSSGELRQIMSYAESNGIMLFSPSSTSPALATPDRINGTIFRDVPNDTYQGAVIANIMYQQGIRAIAVIWRGDTYGDGLVSVVNKTFTALGGKVMLVARYDPSTTDFSSYVSTLANTISQLINQYGKDHVAVYDVSFEEGASILQLASQYPQLTEVKWYGSDGTAGVGSIVQNPVAAQVAVETLFLNPIAAPAHTVFYDQLTQHFNKTLQAYSYITYDIFWIYFYSVLKVGSDNVTAIKSILPKVAAKFYGASGYHLFDKYGDRLSGVYQLQIVNKTASGYEWTIYGIYDVTTHTLTIGFPPAAQPPQGYLYPDDPQAQSKLSSIS